LTGWPRKSAKTEGYLDKSQEGEKWKRKPGQGSRKGARLKVPKITGSRREEEKAYDQRGGEAASNTKSIGKNPQRISEREPEYEILGGMRSRTMRIGPKKKEKEGEAMGTRRERGAP